MVATCLHLAGFVCSFIGWIGVVVATATNDWVVTCGYTITTCRKMDELGSKGLWADCVMATGLYHCKPLVDILILPGYVQACRALMIAASVLGLPAIFLLITVLPCIRMGHEPGAAKYRRSQLGGILIILLGKARRAGGSAAGRHVASWLSTRTWAAAGRAGLTLRLSGSAAVWGGTKGTKGSGRTKTGGREQSRVRKGGLQTPPVCCLAASSGTATAHVCRRVTAAAHRQLPAGTGFAGSPWK
uniref:Claudin n=6 Tax=Neognathae TaxID=8825 RepID=A0A8C4UCQ2_FALTI